MSSNDNNMRAPNLSVPRGRTGAPQTLWYISN
jgi:hypothetical protein